MSCSLTRPFSTCICICNSFPTSFFYIYQSLKYISRCLSLSSSKWRYDHHYSSLHFFLPKLSSLSYSFWQHYWWSLLSLISPAICAIPLSRFTYCCFSSLYFLWFLLSLHLFCTIFILLITCYSSAVHFHGFVFSHFPYYSMKCIFKSCFIPFSIIPDFPYRFFHPISSSVLSEVIFLLTP